MYTFGWPKIQNRCCHNSELPPRWGLKNWVPKPRSSSSSRLAMMRVVNANKIMNAITSTAHANTGIRLSVMPGARIFSTPMMISMPAAIAATSATPRPREPRHPAERQAGGSHLQHPDDDLDAGGDRRDLGHPQPQDPEVQGQVR